MRAYEKVLRDPEAECSALPPARKHVQRWFSDKLGPVRRWMDAHVGQPWDEVRAEIARRFDTRSLAGQHIVFDHMLAEVLEHDVPERYRWHRYRVDEHGILRALPRGPRGHGFRYWSSADERALQAFTRGRKVHRHGSTWFWLELTFVYARVKGVIERVPTGRFRQTCALTAQEIAHLERLPADARKRVLW